MEAVGRLASGVAHDFNNLLTPILGFSDILLRKGKRWETSEREMLEQIAVAGELGAVLVRQLLGFSRPRNVGTKTAELNAVVRNIEKLLLRVLGSGIDTEMKLGSGTISARVDPGQLEQVLMNLVVNAKDAMPDGGKLRIETGKVVLHRERSEPYVDLSPGEYATLEVSDTGLGMDMDTQAKIFEPFFSTKEPGSSTGLGLSTVFGIVQGNGEGSRCGASVEREVRSRSIFRLPSWRKKPSCFGISRRRVARSRAWREIL